MDDRPGTVLTRHFFASLFDFGFLSEVGSDSFKHALLGSVAVAMGIGLLIVRVFMSKYRALAGSPEAYTHAVVADHAFLIALTMWFVAAAVGLVGHSLFPDETDYRILIPEPVPRPTIFRAKLTALLQFAGLFVAGGHVALLPVLVLTLIPAGRYFIPRGLAFFVASVAASLFAALAIVAVHGLLVLLAPRARVLAFATAVRSVLIGVLVLGFPLVLRLPSAAGAFASNAGWLHWAPPAWFEGLERWLIGDRGRGALALEAIFATAAVVVVSVASYVRLYRRFDRVTLRDPHEQSSPLRTLRSGPDRPGGVRRAIERFVRVSLGRSVLHQGLVVALLAAGGGLAVNGLVATEIWHAGSGSHPGVIPTLTWAPMSLIVIACPAIRLALSVPLEIRANWVFRVTDGDDTRGEAIGAGIRTTMALGVALPVAAMAPLQWWAIGPAETVRLIVVEALIGWLLVELLMINWRRVPFTCTYIPGKGFVPHMFVKGVAFYLLFTSWTGTLLRATIEFPRALPVFAVLLGAPAAFLAHRRTRDARLAPLAFEDELPGEINALRLNAD